MSLKVATFSNLEALTRFWRRRPFHDEVIKEVSATNGRVLIRLTDFTLIIKNAKDFKSCEFPAVWLSESIVQKGGQVNLNVETETGTLEVSGLDVRLVRNRDLAMLIPPIDT